MVRIIGETVAVAKCSPHFVFCPATPHVAFTVFVLFMQDSGVVQDIKFGVKLVAGGQKNATLGHNNARRILGDPVVAPTSEAQADGEGGLTNGGETAEAASMATKGTRRLPAVHLEVSRASAGAIEAVEAQGGTVTCAHFNRLALRALVRSTLRLRT